MTSRYPARILCRSARSARKGGRRAWMRSRLRPGQADSAFSASMPTLARTLIHGGRIARGSGPDRCGPTGDQGDMGMPLAVRATGGLLTLLCAISFVAQPALAQDATATLSAGDTAWM